VTHFGLPGNRNDNRHTTMRVSVRRQTEPASGHRDGPALEDQGRRHLPERATGPRPRARMPQSLQGVAENAVPKGALGAWLHFRTTRTPTS
jgi:hypothetical protein